MNKRATTIALATLLLLVAALVILALFRSQAAKGSDPSQASTHEARYPDTSSTNNAPSPRRHGNPEAGLHRITDSKPLGHLGSKAIAEIQAGETLVMGGYQLPDGNHEFTMLTPSLVQMEDGSSRIKIKSRVLAVTPDFARDSGLDSLTTRYSTADQHAEAWSEDHTHSTLGDIAFTSDNKMLHAPSLLVIPGQAATIEIGNENSQARYTVEATVHSTSPGVFAIESQVVRTPAATR